jgi:hypothetical protein
MNSNPCNTRISASIMINALVFDLACIPKVSDITVCTSEHGRRCDPSELEGETIDGLMGGTMHYDGRM